MKSSNNSSNNANEYKVVNVYYVRHCESCSNVMKTGTLWQKLIKRHMITPLCTDIGLQNALRLSEKFKGIKEKEGVDAFVSSPLPRAMITQYMIMKGLGVNKSFDIKVSPRICEKAEIMNKISSSSKANSISDKDFQLWEELFKHTGRSIDSDLIKLYKCQENISKDNFIIKASNNLNDDHDKFVREVITPITVKLNKPEYNMVVVSHNGFIKNLLKTLFKNDKNNNKGIFYDAKKKKFNIGNTNIVHIQYKVYKNKNVKTNYKENCKINKFSDFPTKYNMVKPPSNVNKSTSNVHIKNKSKSINKQCNYKINKNKDNISNYLHKYKVNQQNENIKNHYFPTLNKNIIEKYINQVIGNNALRGDIVNRIIHRYNSEYNGKNISESKLRNLIKQEREFINKRAELKKQINNYYIGKESAVNIAIKNTLHAAYGVGNVRINHSGGTKKFANQIRRKRP